MTAIVNSLFNAAQKRIAFNRTVAEIEAMPRDVALDLGIFREDASLIAHAAVYEGYTDASAFRSQ